MSETQTYAEAKAEIKAEQSTQSYEEILKQMRRDSKFAVELDHLQPQDHNWVDRGEVMSCEFAGHPNHRSFKRRR